MRNTEAEALVAAARSWLGTPYVHQHRCRNVAVDCVGLIIGAGLEARVLPTWTPQEWMPFANYGRSPNPAHMTRAIEQFMEPLDLAPDQPGPDAAVAFMGWRDHLPMHLAIMATAPDGRRTMIHAFAYHGKVVEHGFDGEWPGRVVSWWRYPGVPAGAVA